LLVAAYSTVLVGSRWLAYQIRFDFTIPHAERGLVFQKWAWVLCSQLLFLAGFLQFSGVTRYFSMPEHLMLAMSGSALFLYLLHYCRHDFYSPPRGGILLESMLGFSGLCAMHVE
jgi:hypothetical protein